MLVATVDPAGCMAHQQRALVLETGHRQHRPILRTAGSPQGPQPCSVGDDIHQGERDPEGHRPASAPTRKPAERDPTPPGRRRPARRAASPSPIPPRASPEIPTATDHVVQDRKKGEQHGRHRSGRRRPRRERTPHRAQTQTNAHSYAPEAAVMEHISGRERRTAATTTGSGRGIRPRATRNFARLVEEL